MPKDVKEPYDLDFGIPRGTLIVAAAGGEVIATENRCVEGNTSCGHGFGNYIKIKHDDSYATLYAHLQHNGVIVNVGDHVIAGQPIGFSGNTGNSHGAHLHFGMHEPGRNSIGKSIDDIEIWSRDRNTGQDIWRLVGIPRSNDRAFHCRLNNGTRGHYYEALDINGFIFSPFQCASLSGNAIHCWRGEPDDTGRYHMAGCEDAYYHVRYYKNSSGYHAQELSTANGRDLCNSHTGSADMLAYLSGNGYGGGSSTGGAWQTNPGDSEGTYGNDPHTPSADVHIVHLKIRREDQSHFHTESGKALSPGESVTVFAEGRIENRSNDICDYVKMEYNVTTKKKFRHTEKKTLDDDVLDEDEREDDFQPGDKISKTMRRTTITLSNDMQEVTVATEGRNSYTFPITQKHLYEKKIPLYFWLDVKVRIGNSEDRDVSCNQGSDCDEYAKFEALLPWFNSSFNLSTVGGEAPLQVNFTNTSQTGNGATISYYWDFGDGETSSEENPVHIYNQAGTYIVNLTTTSNWGETRTSRATVVVTDSPIDGVVDTNYGSTDLNSPKVLAEELTEGHCFSGTPTTLLGMGVEGNPWEWTCQGENGGTDETGYAVLEEEETDPRADVNGDGYIDSSDVNLVMMYSLGFDMSGTGWVDSSTTGDVNCDNTTNTTDAMLISRYVNGGDMAGTGWCAE